MPIIEKYTDIADKIRISWKDEDENIFNFKFDSDISDEEVEKLGQKMSDHAKLSAVQPIGDYNEIKDFIVPLIELIKTSSTISFEDFSNTISTLNWNVSLLVRSFIFDFTTKYAEQYFIAIPNQTESTYFEIFSSIINENSNEKLARLMFNEYFLY